MMSSSWNVSWSKSWGNSWGIIESFNVHHRVGNRYRLDEWYGFEDIDDVEFMIQNNLSSIYQNNKKLTFCVKDNHG